MTIMEEEEKNCIIAQKKTMEKQQSFRCVENHHQPRKARALEKQVSFQGVSVENHHQPSRLGRGMEKQQSFRGVNVENNTPRRGGVMEKLPSFGSRASLTEEKQQKSFRGGFLEKQKSFRVVMERQLSFIGERRKKTESPGKRGDSALHIAARTGNLGKVKELIGGCCDGGGEELRELLSKQNLEEETPLYTAAENGQSIVVEEMLKHMDLETASIAARNGFDPFHVAAKQGHLEVLKTLMETCIQPNLLCDDTTGDKEVTLIINIQGSCSTRTSSHHINVRHSSSAKSLSATHSKTTSMTKNLDSPSRHPSDSNRGGSNRSRTDDSTRRGRTDDSTRRG